MRTLLAALVLAPALGSADPADLTARCAAGDTVQRTFRWESSSDLEDMTIVQDGEEMDLAMMGGAEMTQETFATLVVTDAVEAAEDGEAQRFVRTYEEAELETAQFGSMGPGGDMDFGASGETALAELDVVFARDDEGDLVPAWPAGEEGDDALLEGLAGALDLAELVPGETVEVGDTWSVEPRALFALRSPGGDLHHEMEGEGPGTVRRAGDDGATLEGEVLAELTAVVEEDGRRVAEVELTYELVEFVDLTQAEGEIEAEGNVPVEIEMVLATSETEYEGEGTLRWDLDAGRLLTLDLEGDHEEAREHVIAIDFGGQEMEQEQVQVFAGTHSAQVRFDARR